MVGVVCPEEAMVGVVRRVLQRLDEEVVVGVALLVVGVSTLVLDEDVVGVV